MLDIFSKLFHPKSQPHKVGYSTHIGAFEERPCLQHLLPWRSINTKTGVVYGKKNDFFIIFEFRGSDLESATEAELVQYNEAINNVIKNLPTGYVLYLESQRHFASSYDKSKMPEGILQMFEDQRADYYNGKTHFENTYFFIIYYEPPAAIRSKITDA
ncbi:MAG: hypothetical protein MJ050_02465, partial [Phascolarctobacterium sp.]|nr:hypothetical protein [Phascolarctobacterium sp.]